MNEYRPYTGTSTRTHRRHKKDKERNPGLKLAVCIGIILSVLIFRLLFPQAAESISDYFTESSDFKAAFNALGEGLSGERNLSEAVEDAFQYAFSPKREPETSTSADIIIDSEGIYL